MKQMKKFAAYVKRLKTTNEAERKRVFDRSPVDISINSISYRLNGIHARFRSEEEARYRVEKARIERLSEYIDLVDGGLMSATEALDRAKEVKRKSAFETGARRACKACDGRGKVTTYPVSWRSDSLGWRLCSVCQGEGLRQGEREALEESFSRDLGYQER